MGGTNDFIVKPQKVYIVTTDGTFAGAIGDPVIEYHHADLPLYSDFMVRSAYCIHRK